MTHLNGNRFATIFTAILVLMNYSGTSLAEPSSGPKSTVSVGGFDLKSDFRAIYGSSGNGSGLAAMMATALEQTDRFIVVERHDIGDVFDEQQLTAAGLVHNASAAVPGQLIGSQILVFGEVTEFSLSESGSNGSIGLSNLGSGGLGIGLAPSTRKGIVGIDVRLIDSTTSQILSTFSVRADVKSTSLALQVAAKDISVEQQSFSETALGKAARKAINQVVDRVVADTAELDWRGLVVDVEANEVAINAGSNAGVKVGERYQIFRVVKLLRDPATGRILGERKRRVGEILISDVDDEIAFGDLSREAGANPEVNDLVTL